MSLRNSEPKPGADAAPEPESVLSRAVAALRIHSRTWAQRYVDMRVGARTNK